MRILYFHQHFTTPDGSGGTRSYEFARALVARGHQVTMICGRNERSVLKLEWNSRHHWHRGMVDGIDVVAFPLNYSNRDGLFRRAQLFLNFAWRGIGLSLRWSDYDLLFATSTPLTAAIPGIAMKVLGGGRPFVFEVKNPLLLGGMSALEWAAYHCADACIGLSPGIVEGIRRRSPAQRRVDMIPNGCDLDIFTSAKRSRLQLPGVVEGDFVAGFTGAHGIANGLDAVLNAAAELRRRGRMNIKLILIGDGSCKDALLARVSREGLDNCLFFPVMSKTEIAHIVASFDCGLQILANVPAFYYGTSPNKFFDYIAAGIPVLCNYPGWLAELISTYQCGIVIPPENPVAFADALCAMAGDSVARTQMGRRARQLAESAFDRRHLAADFVHVLESQETRLGGRDLTVAGNETGVAKHPQ